MTSFYVIKWVAYNLIHNALQRPPELSSLLVKARLYRSTLKFLIVQSRKQRALSMREHLLALVTSTTIRLQDCSIVTLNEINPTTAPVWVNTDTDTYRERHEYDMRGVRV